MHKQSITQSAVVQTVLNGALRWYKSRWPLVVTAMILALVTGIGVGAARSSGKTEIAAANNRLAASQNELSKSQSDLSTARGETLTATDALTAAQDGLDKQKSELDAAAAAVAAREAKVGVVEKAAQANTFSGDGTYLVGTDVKPGTYKAAATSGCYWARLKSLDTSDIIDNQNTDGPVVLQILATDKAIEVSRCAEFHKVG